MVLPEERVYAASRQHTLHFSAIFAFQLALPVQSCKTRLIKLVRLYLLA